MPADCRLNIQWAVDAFIFLFLVILYSLFCHLSIFKRKKIVFFRLNLQLKFKFTRCIINGVITKYSIFGEG